MKRPLFLAIGCFLVALLTAGAFQGPDGARKPGMYSDEELLQLWEDAPTNESSRNTLLGHLYRTHQLDAAAGLLLEHGDDREVYLFLTNWVPAILNCVPESTATAASKMARSGRIPPELQETANSTADEHPDACKPLDAHDAQRWTRLLSKKQLWN